MKRLILLLQFFSIALLATLAQSNLVTNEIYISPKDGAVLGGSVLTKSSNTSNRNQSTIYRNGAREIVFVDKDGNQVTAVSDTVYVIDGEVIADTLYVEAYDEEVDGYYLNGFTGSQADFEYAERIRRFHNPRYTITIADPDFNDIYFLDDNYWNVYVDGMYATITPTWTNHNYWDYQFSPYSYNSWSWRYNWGFPSYGWGMNSMFGWGYPYYGGNYGFYDSWYYGNYGWGYPYYGGGFGFGYPYYGGGFGWGYPLYGFGYGGAMYQTENQIDRRYQGGSRQLVDSRSTAGRSQLSGAGGMGSRSAANTVVSRQPIGSTGDARTSINTSRVTDRTGVSTSLRTGTVRSASEWRNMVGNSDRINTGTTNVVSNRSNPRVSTNAETTTRSAVNTRGATTATSRTIDNSSTTTRSSSTYSTPTRSSSSGVSIGGGGGATRSSGGSVGGSSGGASRSSGGGGRR